MRTALLLVITASSCGSSSPSTADLPVVVSDAGTSYFGDSHSGNFWTGPVDYSESQWHNACAPSDVKYPALIQQLYGNDIMGLANEASLGGLVAGNGQLCDVCAELSANGQTVVAHVVTYGQETGPSDIDVSTDIDTALNASAGRKLTWRFVSCPTKNSIYYTFDDREWSNTWFFRVWVRNARVPVSKVEYALGAKAWATADWQSDGAWQASSQDFSKGFSLRITALDGQTIEDTVPGLNTFDPNAGVPSHANFQ
jgi:expansin (peptidoglycan-binding protein)